MAHRHSILVLTLAAISADVAPVGGHAGDRVFAIPYLSEETLALLDQDDGTVGDWVDALGEPTLTPLDFNLLPGKSSSYDQHDPASLDFRIWMGWTPDGRIHDSVILLVDGDHTGGKYSWGQTHELEEAVQTNRQAQHYENIAIAPSGVPRIILYRTSVGALTFGEIAVDWMVQPPFARGGGGVFSENPAIWVTEFYVTCFDLLDHLNPENSVVSELAAEKTIGFNLSVSDYDVEPAGRAAFYELINRENAVEVSTGADFFGDGLLLRPDDDFGDSAVQSTSWARIKASLEIEIGSEESFP